MYIQKHFYGLILLLFIVLNSSNSWAKSSNNDANDSNNPLNPAYSFNIQDYYTPKLYGSDKDINDIFFRFSVPILENDLIKVRQIIRASTSISTRPNLQEENQTGIGDFTLFDIFLLPTKNMQIGIGPILVLPTATNDYIGSGKWQAGLASAAVYQTQKINTGALVQWQQSFAGDSDRKDVSIATAQPFVIYNLQQGWYVRSSAIWNFDLKSGDYYIPIGAGAGKVTRIGNTIINIFAEPQWTISHSEDGSPKFTLFTGVNLTFK